MRVGFIGLGIMGKPMCKNVLKAGYEVTVFDRNTVAVEELKNAGAKVAASGKEVGENSEVLITMLPNSPHVKSVLFDENGALEGLKEGTVVIDMSSINPVESKNIAEELAKKGVLLLDAPVSGGEPKAIDGTISVMVGGDEAVFNKYYDLMKSMSGSVVRVGGVGAGNTTKLANQIIVALNIAALSEAFILCEKADVDPQLVFEAIRGGLAGSTVMNAKAPMMMERNFDPGFRIDLHIKDLQNALDTSHAINASLPLTAQIMETLQALKMDGKGDRDHSAIVNYYEKLNNITVGKK
ncbi:MAG: 2-hydroxy-3-oxopropionate reductase [Cetobacterium sp.]|uniref:2-hydroxy-3-oxopropionate reductase n=1 Tax=Cetobacterium sp. ZWU0022 TaxID=1340502 RepID=UPI000648B323|nr:2-hydroxy-3-oxopropionate reductase [Cetobacterium sp. ZWU0022]